MVTTSRKIDVLLVDDNALFIQALRRLLTEICGSHIRSIDEAHNGREALQCISDCRYGLVFMDVDMPEMNGIITTRALDREYARLNIIALSFHDDTLIQEQMIYAGARNYITKDRLSPDVLTEIFDRYVIS